jgi:hypothetical protein
MSTTHAPGSYVTHTKLLELGSGEVISAEKGMIRIRFASGERNFSMEFVQEFLAASETRPELLRPPARSSRSKAKRKA